MPPERNLPVLAERAGCLVFGIITDESFVMETRVRSPVQDHRTGLPQGNDMLRVLNQRQYTMEGNPELVIDGQDSQKSCEGGI